MAGAAALRPWHRLTARLRDASLQRKLAYALAATAAVSGIATVATMSAPNQVDAGIGTTVALVYLDLVLMLLLVGVVARRLLQVWAERRRGVAGAGLQVRFVTLFALVAIMPAVLVAIFSAVFLNFGMQAWFNDKVSTALEQSVNVTRAYLEEHRKNIQVDALAIANDVNRLAPQLMRDRWEFNRLLSTHAALRSLSEAVVVDSTGNVLARAEFSVVPEVENIPRGAMATADTGKIAVLGTENDDRLRALVRLNRFIDAYLLVERFVDPRVLDHIEGIENAVGEYRQLERERGTLHVSFIAIYVVAAVLLLLAAVWTGLTISGQLARPVSGLIDAAERVSDGDLTARVDETAAVDELGTLSRTFNRMTLQLSSQQEGLMQANRELDERRRFTETVLAGVSAGVVGLDAEQRINLPNRSAQLLLGTDLGRQRGRPLTEVAPEMAELLESARARPDRLHQSELRLSRGGTVRTLLARIAAERLSGEVIGYVVTFDDVTELLSAQRKAAWGDVARRIAHEIKNPLTPIQLSAERLKRKYADEITSDPETFRKCTETIIRQVEDIGRMVDEFSSFARMPELSIHRENLSEICRQAVFLEANRHDDIRFETDLPERDVELPCDTRQVSRALTNILKNAAESVESRRAADGPEAAFGTVGVRLGEAGEGSGREVRLIVEDDGIGLPAADRERLTEPYVTTRTKGTGLGLAIVKKIMEDHGGELRLEDRESGGARITLLFRPDELDGRLEPAHTAVRHGTGNETDGDEGGARLTSSLAGTKARK